MNNLKKTSIEYIENLIERYPKLHSLQKPIIKAIVCLLNSVKNSGKILICGNGGSSSDSDHIVGELVKDFLIDRSVNKNIQEILGEKFPLEKDYFIENLKPGIPAISLTSNNALISAISNDHNNDFIYAQQVLVYGNKQDTLILLSTSGNSKNIINAAKIANIKDISVISLTGNSGGKLLEYSDILINAPAKETYKVQEYHLPIYHLICIVLENEIYGNK